ncbi:MAG: hypothetical protein PVG22_15330 [Chromatiales bacterium]
MYTKNIIIGFVAAMILAVIFCDYAVSEEVSPFRVTDVDGEIYVHYLNDIYRDKSYGEESSRREGKVLETGIDVTLFSYIYHPNFFRLNFGGGPVSFRHIYDSNLVHENYQDEYLNFHSKAYLLEKKAYPTILYYDRYYSTTPYAVQDQMILRNERYGVNFKLRRPLTPALVDIDVSRVNIDGENLMRITDETTDRAAINISGDLGSNGDGSINYSVLQNISGSRSQTLDSQEVQENFPITQEIRLLDIGTEHLFGQDEWIRLTNSLIYKEQDQRPELEELRFTPYLYLTHSEKLTSHYRYSYLNRTIEGINLLAYELDGGMSQLSFDDRLETDVDLRFDRYESLGIKQKYYNGEVNLSYLQPYDRFNLRYYGGWGIDHTNQESDGANVQVRGEPHQVEQVFESFDLDQRNVIEGTVVIEDDRGNLYTEGTDYQLNTVGDVTSVEWIGEVPVDPAGNPLTLLVSYEYNSGGTFAYSTYRQLYGIELLGGNIYRLYARYHDLNRDLKSGEPFIPLNSQDITTFGFQVDYPMANQWLVGGRAEHQINDADVGSYRSSSAGAYLQLPRIIKGNLRLYTDWLYVDNLDTVQDVDLIRYGFRYQSRLWNRTTLTADLLDENDTGGVNDKHRTAAKILFGWTYRQLTFTAEARYNANKLGNSETKHSSIDFLLTRRF